MKELFPVPGPATLRLIVLVLLLGLASFADDKKPVLNQPVTVTNTPSVNVANTPSVNVANIPTVNIGTMPAVNALLPGNMSVTISNTPNVNVVNTPTVNIGTMPPVTATLPSNATVAVSSLPAVTVASTPPVIVGNTDPIPVTSKITPYMASCGMSVLLQSQNDLGYMVCNLNPVPPGKLLVVQTFEYSGFGPFDGSTQTQVGSLQLIELIAPYQHNGFFHYFPPGAGNLSVLHQQTTLYADGTQAFQCRPIVNLSPTFNNGAAFSFSCNVIGYLIDAPQ